MPIKDAERISGGEFVNIKELGGENVGDPGTLCVFRIVAWESEEHIAVSEEYGWSMPFVFDIITIPLDEDGEQDGEPEVWTGQDMRFGQNPMWVLRGHARPKPDVKRRDLPKPINEVGDEIIGRVLLRKGTKPDSKPYPILNKASREERALALKVRESLGGYEWGADGGTAAPSAAGSSTANDEDPPF